MDEGLFADILAQMAALQGLKVMLSGGEPVLHPGFWSLAEKASSSPLRSVLITHGEWIGREQASRLAGLFHQVQVSLDGWEPGHDELRGKGSFRRVTGALEALTAAGLQVAVGTMVHEGNLGEFEAMSDLLEDLGVSEWNIDVPCPAGRWKERDPGLLRRLSEKLRYSFGGSYHGGGEGLACGSHLMTVGPDGTAAKCGFYFHEPAGNVRGGLGRAWSRVGHIPLSRLECDCRWISQCGGGCRFRAEVLEGSTLAPDQVQCYVRGVR